MFVLLDSIVITEEFKSTLPRPKKFKKHYDYFRKYHTLMKPIVLSSDNVLLDGYIDYLIAKMMMIKNVNCIMTIFNDRVEEVSTNA